MSQPDSRVDMNLFRILDAVYTHDGISGAARALHLTQPAITHSLNKLRELLNDPLFVRQGNRMVATHKTRMIMPKIRLHLNGLREMMHVQDVFDPSKVEMSFTIGAHDPFEWVFLPILVARLEKEAPRVKVVSLDVDRNDIERDLTAGGLDLVIDRPLHMSPKIHGQELSDEPLVVVMRKDHPLASGVLQRSDYFEAQHISVTPGSKDDPLDVVLIEYGKRRNIGFVCQHFFGACQVVARTNALLTMPNSYARELSTVLPVTVCPLPVHFKSVLIHMYWHESKQADPPHEWLRQLVCDAFAEKATEYAIAAAAASGPSSPVTTIV